MNCNFHNRFEQLIELTVDEIERDSDQDITDWMWYIGTSYCIPFLFSTHLSQFNPAVLSPVLEAPNEQLKHP